MRFSVLNFAALLSLLQFAEQACAQTLEDVERKALAARKNIRTMTVNARAQTKVGNDSYAINSWSIWWNGPDKNRGDVVLNNKPRNCQIVGCNRPGWVMEIAGDIHVCGSFEPVGRIEKQFHWNVDPRFLGYSSDASGSYKGFQDVVLGDSTREKENLRTIELANSEKAYELTWVNNRAVALFRRVIIRPQNGWNISLLETTYTASGKKFVETAVVDLVQYGPNQIWFPKKIVYTQVIDGVAGNTGTMTFDSVTINEPIPDRVFTLEGADIPLNKPFCLPKNAPESMSAYWDGTKLVRNTHHPVEEAATPVDPPPSADRNNYWLVAVCVFCSLVALALLFFRRQRT